MGIRAIVTDYDAGTAVPGSGAAAVPWAGMLDNLPPKLRDDITSIRYVPRSMGRYIPLLVKHAVTDTLDAGDRFLLLGGDHSLSYYSTWGAREAAGGLDVIHCDAHHDSYPVKYLSNYSFAYHSPRDFGHRWNGVGWRFEMDQPAPPILDHIVPGQSWLSFDFDYFDPAYFWAVRFPVDSVDDGPTVRELGLTLDRMTGPILGADLLEWVPSGQDNITDRVVMDVLMMTIRALSPSRVPAETT